LVVEGRVGIDRVCLLSGDESLPRIAQPNSLLEGSENQVDRAASFR
jgi:hypothetical protein